MDGLSSYSDVNKDAFFERLLAHGCSVVVRFAVLLLNFVIFKMRQSDNYENQLT
jgi:hypothetical protein